MGCARFLHLPGACVNVMVLLSLYYCRLQHFVNVYPVWTNAMNEFVISKAGVQSCCARNQKCFSFGGSTNQINRFTRLEGLDGRLFSSTQFSEQKENFTFL